MLQFTRKALTLALKAPLLSISLPTRYLFCNAKPLSPTYQKIKDSFISKGKNSEEYQQSMVKAIQEALAKYDYPEAINIELFHLSLIKESEGETSESYREEIREIIKFSMNRLQFEVAAKLIEELRDIQKKIPDISPLDVVASLYVQGHVYSELGRLEESKKCLNECLAMKEVQDGPEVYFKIFAQLAKVHIKLEEKTEAMEKMDFCQKILLSRQIDPKSPPMFIAMALQNIFTLAQLASSLNNKDLALKHMNLYQSRMQAITDNKSPFYVEYLQRISKIHFTLKQFEQAIKYLEEAAVLSEELGKVNKRFLENATVMRDIKRSIENEYMKK